MRKAHVQNSPLYVGGCVEKPPTFQENDDEEIWEKARHQKVLNPVECSSVLSPEGEGQVCDENKHLVRRQEVPRSNTLSPNASKRENAESKSRKAMN
ncbi:hypothetical protein H5410_036133 [Solanum commersonii]|uniref:Uncharacterized protein n=1 Tax=Solanum commersonii TaxID=4109 RepID=A0A9J5Y3W5_SOLCO|nr:hypothetical protein H5410_036133 [Solanum commersonii]